MFGDVLGSGYSYALIDQMLHMREWFGRTTALGDDGYRLNRIHGVNCFVINDFASQFLFLADDGRIESAAAKSREPQSA